ncbi:MAG: hypothetical protein K0Q55_4012 [Verrucomicrobia bacterium]|nr:hypothetical protein [Verrucomicrobiota bacterium]
MKSVIKGMFFWGVIICLSLRGAITTARAADIVNNLSAADVNGEMFYNLTSAKLGAQAFRTDNQNYTLNSLVVKLADFVGASTAQISLRMDNDGVPGTVVETLGNISISGQVSVDYTKNSSTHPVLTANTKYWVVIKYVGGDCRTICYPWTMVKYGRLRWRKVIF